MSYKRTTRHRAAQFDGRDDDIHDTLGGSLVRNPLILFFFILLNYYCSRQKNLLTHYPFLSFHSCPRPRSLQKPSIDFSGPRRALNAAPQHAQSRRSRHSRLFAEHDAITREFGLRVEKTTSRNCEHGEELLSDDHDARSN